MRACVSELCVCVMVCACVNAATIACFALRRDVHVARGSEGGGLGGCKGCMCVFDMYVCNMMCIYVHLFYVYVCVHVHVHVHVYLYCCVHCTRIFLCLVHIHIYISMVLCAFAYVDGLVSVCTYGCACVCVCVCVIEFVCIYILLWVGNL